MRELCPTTGTELLGHNFAARLLVMGHRTAWRHGTCTPLTFTSALLDLFCLFASFLPPSKSDIVQHLVMPSHPCPESRVLCAAPQNRS